ncbi:MAG TPA: PHB depolymerase family esterase [Candidatus Acidoferrales bacterium]|nr:PHB depolymerase family esterase [Candidatus Acidoferrales bacterium]
MRFSLRFWVIGVVAAILIASALYWVAQDSQNLNEQRVSPGDSHVTLTFQGYTRTYDLHVPPQYDGKTLLPLVFALHPFGSDAATFAKGTGWNQKADAGGFFVVYPQGLENSWNAGSCCRPSSQQIYDDAGFIKMLLMKLKSELPVNDSRVYVVGASNGGMMAYRLACDFSDDFAAIAAVSATSVVEQCNATEPVSVLAVHGTADTVIPYNNSTRSASSLPVPPAVDAISYWAQRDRTVSVSRSQVEGNVTVTTYSGGLRGTEVILYTLTGGTHEWPSEIPTTDLIWRFFELHPRRPA